MRIVGFSFVANFIAFEMRFVMTCRNCILSIRAKPMFFSIALIKCIFGFVFTAILISSSNIVYISIFSRNKETE